MARKSDPIKQDQLTPEEKSRLWQHGMHEDQVFNNRLQFFLALETMLFGLVALLLGNFIRDENPSPVQSLIFRLVLGLGLLLTLVWSYVQARQRYVFENLRNRIRKHLPEYNITRDEREKIRWPFSNLTLLTYIIPGIFILLWIALQFIVP
jgi:hypothetical protein